ncbi:FUSC family protein [Variovorax paradoxus]|nr:FUSC family protein [Variovorax paradoxus]
MKDSAWRQGLQFAAAVVLSYLASAALRLPESFWAVMSALIVMRPSAASTFDAAWDRVRGTLAGTGLGLSGVWLQHRFGLGSTAATLGIVALLALGSAWFASMRSAPIAALIVLSSGGMAGHPALAVAGLRVAEIAIGVATGLAISMLGLAVGTRARFDAACASVLRRIAADMRRDLGPLPSIAKEKEIAAGASRLALRELAAIAAGAEREAKLRRWLRRRAKDGAEDFARTARLVARITNDAALFARLADSTPPGPDEAAWAALAHAAGRALETSADSLQTRDAPDLAALRRFAAHATPDAGSPSPSSPIPWIAPAARLLLQDLAALARPRPADMA